MKQMNFLLLLFFCSVTFSLNSCGEAPIEATNMKTYVQPVADFMNGTPGVQLFSYFDNHKEEPVTLEAQICTSGSYGKKPALFTCAFELEGVKFKNVVMVSEEDKEKIQETLKKLEVDTKGEKEEITVVFEATLVKKGSTKSPFGGEINLKFDNGKVLQIR